MEILVSTHSSLPAEPSATGAAALEAVVRRQEAAGVDVLTDGQVSGVDLVARVLAMVDGLHGGPVVRRRPVFAESVRATRALTTRTVKALLPGPLSLAAAVLPDQHAWQRFADLALEFAEVVAAEVADVVAAGADMVQVAEPTALRAPQDFRLLRRVLEPAWMARGRARLVFAPGPGDAAAAYAQLDSVPADVLAIDLVANPGLADVVAATGAGKVLALGLVDARTAAGGEAATMARVVERMVKRYTFDAVYLQPAGGLGDAAPDDAWRALSLLGAVRGMMRA